MNREEIRRIYSRYAAVYDILFAQSFFPRIRLGLQKIGIKPGDTIIEVGVGTGLSLELYPESCRVVGIDITRKMLTKAKEKKDKFGFDHVSLLEMDAENMSFADDSFDHAVVPFIVSVVPNPIKMMAEIKRIVKNNGKIIVINHFSSKNAVLARLEKFFSPLFLRLGWTAAVPIDLLKNHCNLYIEEVSKKYRLDPWFIIHATNKK
ncbi:MAG TPA: methyltransferase domain-containing protein [Syntrophorhabdaceae bacterium]|jgi:phosphatidylethanolamine/phosphatidyl-N-methylethanolamine N-methyltransferase